MRQTSLIRPIIKERVDCRVGSNPRQYPERVKNLLCPREHRGYFKPLAPPHTAHSGAPDDSKQTTMTGRECQTRSGGAPTSPPAPRSRRSRLGSRAACCLLAAAVATPLTAEAWVIAPVTSRSSGGRNGHRLGRNSRRVEQQRRGDGGVVAMGQLSGGAGERRRVSCRSQATVDGESTGVYRFSTCCCTRSCTYYRQTSSNKVS